MVNPEFKFESETPIHDAERERLKSKAWIQTFTGKRFWPLSPRAQDVCIEDIAHALALKTRYTGHTRIPYSVAEHCVRVSYVVHPAFALPALLHDAGEAYLPDLASPVKGSFRVSRSTDYLQDVPWTFRSVEADVLDAVFDGLGLTSLRLVAESEEVKRADLIMLATEAQQLLVFSGVDGAPSIEDWRLTQQPIRPAPHLGWTWEEAERKFLNRFTELTTGGA